MRTKIIGSVAVCVVLLTADGGSAETRSYFRHRAGAAVDTVTYPVVDSLISVKLDGSVTPDELVSFARQSRLLDSSYEPWTYGEGFWVFRTRSGATFDLARDSLLTRDDVRFVNPVLAWHSRGLMFLEDRITVFFYPSTASVSMDSLRASLGMERVSVDSVSSRLWQLRKAGNELGDIVQAGARLFESGLAEFVQPEFTATGTLCAAAYDSVPNDPRFDNQWYFRNLYVPDTVDPDIDADSAWDITTGSGDVAIVWVDCGIEETHEDLARATLFYHEYDAAGFEADNPNGQDSDANIHCTDNRLACFHGTATVGLVFAKTDNDTGMAGLAPNCRLMPVKVVAENVTQDEVRSGDLFLGVKHILATWRLHLQGAKGYEAAPAIVSSQIIDAEYFPTDAYWDTLYNEGVLWINSAAGQYPLYFPGSLSTVRAVNRSNYLDLVDFLSSGSPEIDYAAPGYGINTLDLTGAGGQSPGNYVSGVDGTSYSAPLVAGTAALVYSRRPDLIPTNGPPTTIIEILDSTAEDRVGPEEWDSTGWDRFYGNGRINAYHALLSVIHGDVDNNGVYNVQDVTGTVDVAFRGAAPPAWYPAVTNNNCDGVTSVQDVVGIAAIVFRNFSLPPPCYRFLD